MFSVTTKHTRKYCSGGSFVCYLFPSEHTQVIIFQVTCWYVVKCCGSTFILTTGQFTYLQQPDGLNLGGYTYLLYSDIASLHFISISMELFTIHSNDLLKWLLSGFKLISSQDFSSKPLCKSKRKKEKQSFVRQCFQICDSRKMISNIAQLCFLLYFQVKCKPLF